MCGLHKILFLFSFQLLCFLCVRESFVTTIRYRGNEFESILINSSDHSRRLQLLRRNYQNNVGDANQHEERINKLWINASDIPYQRVKRFDDSTTFQGHPKTREERWHANFNVNRTNLQLEQAHSLVKLLNKVVDKYLNACIPIVLYDRNVEQSDGIILQVFFQSIKISYLHGKINENYTVLNQRLLQPHDTKCRSYILFLSDVLRTRDVIGPQTKNHVVLIPKSTQWKLQEFLSSKVASDIVNLLVIGESMTTDPSKEKLYVLYTHRLYTDGLGSNSPIVLTSWIKDKLSRPHINLFPKKFRLGFAGHRFTVTAIHQPPYVLKSLSTDGVGNTKINWDGFELRVLKLLSQRLNFTFEIIEPASGNELGPTYGIIDLVEQRRADIGLAGAFVSNERIARIDMSHQHSTDCAAFITLSSKALPRYRAIMGPFQWPVWLAIIATYLFAIFPMAFSDRLTLSHLIGNYGEIENMFWYVFGTFTNSLTFTGQFSWSKTKKTSTRMLIGAYWIFSIIITACYTGSIIAFVTLPVFPDTIDTIADLLSGFYRVGTLSKDGWQYWFMNSSDSQTRKLLKNLELVSDVEEGLSNVTQAFFWGYAFLGSRAQLQFIVQNNFTDKSFSKQSALHISDECLTIFGISFIFPHDSVFTSSLNEAILRFDSSGFNKKITNEMAWDLQRSDTGRLLQAAKRKKFSFADVVERKLNLADTEGMFLLMAIGYLTAASVLVSEMVGGCARKCRQIVLRNSQTIGSFASSIQPDTSNRPSFASPAAERKSSTISLQKKIKHTVFNRFRRKSEQTVEKTLPWSMKKHKRTNSLSIGGQEFTKNEVHKCADNSVDLSTSKKIENQIVVENVRQTAEADGISLIGSSSLCSPSRVIQEEHTVEINRAPTPNTKNEFDTQEFGEVVQF